jgi:hypothetical protein
MQYSTAMDIDANRRTIDTNEAFKTPKTVSFDGTAGNGAVGAVSLFTVTGTVVFALVPRCTESLAGPTATFEVGISGDTAALVAQGTATDIDAGEFYASGSWSALNDIPATKVVANGNDVIATIGTADVTDGTIEFYILWRPLSSDGNVVAA